MNSQGQPAAKKAEILRGNQQKKGWNSPGQLAAKKAGILRGNQQKKRLEFTGATRKKAEIIKVTSRERLEFSETISSKKG